jgi:hypothetical protein
LFSRLARVSFPIAFDPICSAESTGAAMITIDKDALRALVAKFKVELAEAKAYSAVTNISGARPGEPMRDMTDWFRARINSEIGYWEETIALAEGLLNA